MKNTPVIAIDGPAGSGKSTAARKLAHAIGFTHLNTGAMYRAVAHLADEGGIELNDPAKQSAIADVARKMHFEYRLAKEGEQHFYVNGEDRTAALFTAALTGMLKPVVNNLDVRHELVQKMRDAVEALSGATKGVVMEGRDIGTVVFPHAALKFYIHADLDARAHRRMKELHKRNEVVDFEGIKKQIKYRDETDKGREVGQLVQAADAIDVDTTHLDEAATLTRLIDEVKRRGLI